MKSLSMFASPGRAHSISNAGNNGSNRLLPRRQLLSCGTETDACSGNIAKHFHAVLLAEYLEAAGGPLCPACKVRDGRRAAALTDQADYKHLTIEQTIRDCGVCDTHGFLVTAKNATSDGTTETRQRREPNTRSSSSPLHWPCLRSAQKPLS